jgi:NADH-quinone oxidoreductase subunit G
MIEQPRDLYLLLGFEPEMDVADPAQMAAAMRTAQVIALSSYRTPWLEEHADILLPIGGYAETSGTLVNIEGVPQRFVGVTTPVGEARPAWKVLRVLGNLTDVDGFDYVDSGEVRDEVLAACDGFAPDNAVGSLSSAGPELTPATWERIGGVPMYSVDALTRRSPALQKTPDAWGGVLRMNAAAAGSLGVENGASVRVVQGEGGAEFAVSIDEAVPDGCIWLPSAIPGSENLGPGFAAVSVEKV